MKIVAEISGSVCLWDTSDPSTWMVEMVRKKIAFLHLASGMARRYECTVPLRFAPGNFYLAHFSLLKFPIRLSGENLSALDVRKMQF